MRPRYEDERMGYFSSVKTVYNTAKRVYRPKYVSRWRIEPRPEDVVRYQAGELVEPARPIVFYFDPATPELIKKYARVGNIVGIRRSRPLVLKMPYKCGIFPGKILIVKI